MTPGSHFLSSIPPDQPLISIIVPSFNQARFIRETIESCLTQDYRPLEVIIIDGASTDGTVDILHEYDGVPELRWVSEPDQGPADAVNKGLHMARGFIGGIQASDDAYLPGAMRAAVEQLRGEPGLGLVYADVKQINSDGTARKLFRSAPYSIESFLCGASLILQPSTFFDLALARHLGGWNAEYFTCDTELWLRMVFRTRAKKVDAVWAMRHLHEAQRNNQAARIVASAKRMVAESPDLRAASPRLRRAAWCGVLQMEAGYMPGSERRRRWLLMRAIQTFPAVLRYNPSLLSQVLPGYWGIRSALMRLQRAPQKVIRLLGRGA